MSEKKSQNKIAQFFPIADWLTRYNQDKFNSDVFAGTIQIGSSRPVFNSTYQSPIYNFNDREFNFRYLEFQALNYSPSQFESNLVSVLAFHVYIILGMTNSYFW